MLSSIFRRQETKKTVKYNMVLSHIKTLIKLSYVGDESDVQDLVLQATLCLNFA